MPPATPASKSSTNNGSAKRTETPQQQRDESAEADAPDSNVKQKKRRLGVDPSLIISDERSKRRRSPSHDQDAGDGMGGATEGLYDPKDPERAKALGGEIYKMIIDSKDSDGESMAEPFVKLPNKRSFPDYYETIKVPMSLEMVDEKLQSGQYDTLKAVVADIGQIFNNAKRYNVKESLIFQYAKKMHKMTRTFYLEKSSPGKIEEESDVEDVKPDSPPPPPPPARNEPSQSVEAEDVDMAGPSTGSVDGDSAGARTIKRRGAYMKDGPTVYKLVKPVLKAIREAKSRDGSGREIAGIFAELPDRKDFVDYYKTIKQPISLKEIEHSMMARLYQTWEQFFDDVELMCSNAMVYNTDESEVFIDARQIKEVLDFHRREIHDRLSRPPQLQTASAHKYRPKAPVATPGRPDYNPSYPYNQSFASPSPASYPSQSPQPLAGMPQTALPGAAGPASFLPALPKGVVTEDIVASLDRYPIYEQQAWMATLPPLAVQMYRQMATSNEMKKRGVVPSPQPAPLQDLPSAARPNGVPVVPDRAAPPHPTIKCLDFAFSAPGQPQEKTEAIRLYNLRGVITHAVVLGPETSDIELTAYVADKHYKLDPAASTAAEVTPEISLRVNGVPGNLPKYVYEQTTTPDTAEGKPKGMKWSIPIPLSRKESKIDVVATKPGSLAEVTAIYVHRRF